MATYRVRNANPNLSNGYVIEQQVGGTSILGQQIVGGRWSIINSALTAQEVGQIAGNLERQGDVSYPAGFTTATTPSRATTTIGTDPAFRSRQLGGGEPAPTGIGTVPELNPDDFYWKWDDVTSGMIPAKKGESGATFSSTWWAEANQARTDATSGTGTGGRTGPTAAELAIQRSQVDAQNLATFISGTIAELELEIDSKRLTTEQAIGEFNKRLDAFAEAGKQFKDIQPYTIPIGAEYAPGFQPGGIGEQLGIAPRKAEVVQFDPFAQANQLVNESQDLTEIGVPSGDALAAVVAMAKRFQ